MADTRTGKGGNLAVVLTEFNRDDATAGLQVVERDIPRPKAGDAMWKPVRRASTTSSLRLPMLSWYE